MGTEDATTTGLDCPDCDNQGYYMVADANGDPIPEQCQWCYMVHDSKFNLKSND